MPAYATHYIFARELMDSIKEKNQGQLCEDAVYFGTQGPDIFFFHRSLPTMPGRSCRKVGSAMHREKPSVLLDGMANYVRDSHCDVTALSYAYGFLCHYALDRVVHPFVYGIQATIVGRHPMLKGFTVHNTIEFSLDNVILQHKLGQAQPWLFDTASTVPSNENVIERVSEMLNYVIPFTTDIFVTKSQISQAMRDTKLIQKRTHDQSGCKAVALKTAEALAAPLLAGYRISVMMRPRNLDKCLRFVNENHGKWTNPSEPDIPRRESFFDLYDRAKAECLKLIDGFNRAVETGESMSGLTGELSFLTGIYVE